MTDWSSVEVANWWPLLLVAALGATLVLVWLRRKGELFPDIRLLADSTPMGDIVDRLPVIIGVAVLVLLAISLMGISTSRSVVVERSARDFLVTVDTSRSMRKSTTLLREEFPTTYERKASLFSDRDGIYSKVDDTTAIPQLARYELARESLLDFLSSRREEDRVELIYFNDEVYVMSGFTSDRDFLRQQLAAMDSYVNGGTKIALALDRGLDMAERYPSENRRAVILLTDAEAEARSMEDLQRQMERLSRSDVAFYLLWITADANGEISDEARSFLRSARSIGTVFTIEDLGEGHLDRALEEIGRLEDYVYEEVRHERLDLSRHLFTAARWLMLVWILLIATIHHPVRTAWISGTR